MSVAQKNYKFQAKIDPPTRLRMVWFEHLPKNQIISLKNEMEIFRF